MEQTSKKCCSCEIIKSYNLFYKNKRAPDGLTGACGECINSRNRNKSTSKELDYSLELACITCKETKNSKLFSPCKNKKNGFTSICKACSVKRVEEWKVSNIEKARAYKREYQKNRKDSDPLFKLNSTIYSFMNSSVKRACEGKYKKSKSTENILGCSVEEFIKYLKSLFTEGMSLDNYGSCEECWNIDHIYPISKATSEEHIIQLNHFSNLQPLWRNDNIKKGNKIL